MNDHPEKSTSISAERRAQLAARLRSAAGATLATEPIAVVGIGCRFPPDLSSPGAFWKALNNRHDAIREVPADRWDIDAFYDPDPDAPGKVTTRWGGFLKRVDEFDARFFGVSPREAACMDPQQRLLLETAWEALEHAGQVPSHLAGTRTGVFIGICSNEYSVGQVGDLRAIDAYSSTGGSSSIAANRLSYWFDFQGPSIALDTACSSSLVAVHLACQSLRSEECRVALAGGVNLTLYPIATISFSRWGMMAPDGRCKTFDARADGFVRGEGCGIVVLKRLADAVADGDTLLGLIRGSAVNQDGKSNGLTAPNVLSQEACIRQALDNARVMPSQVSYVETHGTGTSLGDPIEVEALRNTYGRALGRKPLILGAVKTNLGHLEGAAGVAGLIKALLCLQHPVVPPNLHFRSLNPHISMEGTPLVIATDPTPWPEVERRLAAVSSFGFGGTNAHIILEEPPVPTPESPSAAGPFPDGRSSFPSGATDYLLPLSAPTPGGLMDLARGYPAYLSEGGEGGTFSLRDILDTAASRRTHFQYRKAFTGQNHTELADRITLWLSDPDLSPEATDGPPRLEPRVVFVFSGQGPQWWGMGRQLLNTRPVFRDSLNATDKALRRSLSWSVLEELTRDEGSSRLNDTEVAQPVLFAFHVALARLWLSLGIPFHGAIGHSLGEIAAAHLCGALSLDDACRLVALRGRILARATGQGRMVAVEMTPEEAVAVLQGLEEEAGVGAVNGPTSLVLTGSTAAMDQVMDRLEARGLPSRPLRVDYAFHSPTLEPLQRELAQALSSGGGDRSAIPHPGTLPPAAPSTAPMNTTVPFYSTVTGAELPGSALDASYWSRQIRAPVQFSAAADSAIRSGARVFIEVGPHPVLSGALEDALRRADGLGGVVPTLRRGTEEGRGLVEALAQLYALRITPSWHTLHPRGRCVPLPLFPWQRSRFWIDGSGITGLTPRVGGVGPPRGTGTLLSGPHLELAHDPGTHCWESDLDPQDHPWLPDHRVEESAVFPASGYVELAIEAASRLFPGRTVTLENLILIKALVLPDAGTTRIQVVVRREEVVPLAVSIYSRSAENPSAAGDLSPGAPSGAAGGTRSGSTDPPVGGGRLEQPAVSWTLHARGSLREVDSTLLPSPPERDTPGSGLEPLLSLPPDPSRTGRDVLDLLRRRCPLEVPSEAHYEALAIRGMNYRGRFRGIRQLWQGQGEALAALVEAPASDTQAPPYLVHPAVLDAAFQVIGATVQGEEGDGVWMPVSIRSLRLHKTGRVPTWSYGRHRPSGAGTSSGRAPESPGSGTSGAEKIESDLYLLDSDGSLVMEILGFCIQRLIVPGHDPLNAWCHRVEWRHRPLERLPDRQLRGKGTWLLVADRSGASAGWAGSLENRGFRTRRLLPEALPGIAPSGYAGDLILIGGDKEPDLLSPSTPGDGSFATRKAPGTESPPREVDSREPLQEHPDGVSRTQPSPGRPWEALLRAIPSLTHIVHLTSFDTPPQPHRVEDALDVVEQATLPDLTRMVHALSESTFRDLPRLWVVTRGAQAVTPGESVEPAQTAIWGFARSLAHEHPQMRSTLVDLTADPALDSCDALTDEILCDGDDQELALRPERRYVARLTRGLPAVPGAEIPPRRDGTVLITGGMGGIGLVLAEGLLQHGYTSVTLVGRSAPGAEGLAVIRRLNTSEEVVRVIQADLSQEEEVRRVLFLIQQGPRPLVGIVHAAGVVRDGLIGRLTAEDFRAVLGPKAKGAWHLHRLTRDLPLDFFVFCSSAAAILGSPGQANYAAANAFLDGLAVLRVHQGLPALSIGWGPWAGVGMAASQANRGERVGSLGMDSILPQDGLKAFHRLLRNPLPHLGVMPINLRRWSEMFLSVATAPFLSEVLELETRQARDNAKRNHMRVSLLAAPPAERLGMLEAHLQQQISEVLRLPPDQLKTRTPLGSLGIDSLVGLEIRNRLEATLGEKLGASLVYGYPDIAALARYLAARLGLDQDAPDTQESPAAPEPPPMSAPSGSTDLMETSLTDLPPDEIRRLLEQELQEMEDLL